MTHEIRSSVSFLLHHMLHCKVNFPNLIISLIVYSVCLFNNNNQYIQSTHSGNDILASFCYQRLYCSPDSKLASNLVDPLTIWHNYSKNCILLSSMCNMMLLIWNCGNRLGASSYGKTFASASTVNHLIAKTWIIQLVGCIPFVWEQLDDWLNKLGMTHSGASDHNHHHKLRTTDDIRVATWREVMRTGFDVWRKLTPVHCHRDKYLMSSWLALSSLIVKALYHLQHGLFAVGLKGINLISFVM